MDRSGLIAVAAFLISGPWSSANAIPFGGIEFPQGLSSFADALIRYDPLYSGGSAPTHPDFIDPLDALGAPDSAPPVGSISLGHGGLIELGFVDNVLTNSGDSSLDLHVFEIGTAVENTLVAIRPTSSTLPLISGFTDPNGDGFYELGGFPGGITSIDIDLIFPGFTAGALRFDAVQLIDDVNQGPIGPGDTVGADIDAVGAISSLRVAEPGSALLAIGALFAMYGQRTSRNRA